MKPKKLSILIAICLVTAVGALGIIVFLCGPADKNNENGVELSTSDTLTVSKMEQLLAEIMVQESFEGDDLPISYKYANAIVNATKYEIMEIAEQNTAIVKFEYVDVLKMADEYTGSNEDPDKFYLYCIEKIENGTAPTITNETEITVAVNESDGTYSIIDNLDLANALTGGVASEYLDFFNGRS